MDPHNFCYWLNGFAELHGDEPPTAAQWKSIREHLALVFEKVTPPVGPARTVLTDWLARPTTSGDPWQYPLQARCSAADALVYGDARSRTYC